jgi:hypothetical protein
MLNLIVLNRIHAPSWWNVGGIWKNSSVSKSIKKIIEKHADFLEEKEKEYMSNNKKI